MSLSQKQNELETILRAMESVVVAFSGGVDSSLVLAVARSVLAEDRVLAVTAQSPSVSQRELDTAREVAQTLAVRHRVVATGEAALPEYISNPANRCYYCKTELYSHLEPIRKEEHFAHVVNGTNRDDLGDHRPGLVSAKEAGVRSPLCEAGFTKQDVRDLARHLQLPVWDKPAKPCLASRIPYEQEVTPEKLKRVEQAEEVLIGLGFRELRVRHLGETARIEVAPEELPRLMEPAVSQDVRDRIRAIGFQQVVIDPKGFRSGNLNDALSNPNIEEDNHVSI